MCLATLTANKTTKRVGYKVLYCDLNTGELTTGMCSAARIPITTDKYAKDPNKGTITGHGTTMFKYPAGFHVCLDKKDAYTIQSHQKGVVCKVRFRKSVAVGEVRWDWLSGPRLRSETVVAKEVKLIGKDTPL